MNGRLLKITLKYEFGFIAQDVKAIPELAFLVDGEEIVSRAIYVNPEDADESCVKRYCYVKDEKKIDEKEWMMLNVEEQEKYTKELMAIEKKIDTQNVLALDYNGIFTITVGAVQELDKQLQAEKLKVVSLEGRLLDLLSRVEALESA